MRTIPEMFTAVAEQNAGRTAVVDGEKTLSYAALADRVRSLAFKLQSLGVCEGDCVGLLLPNGIDFIESYFAVASLGAIIVPLNDHYQQLELLYFVEQCGVSLLITTKDHAELCDQVILKRESQCKLFFVEDHADAIAASANFADDVRVKIDPDAPVMHQFSSGSTGRPKQIARSHLNLLFELDSLMRTLKITNDDRFLGVAPFSHVNGLMRSMMTSIRGGATLYPLPRFERRAVAETIEKYNISVFIAVPFMFSMLAQTNFKRRPDFSSLRLCVSASAPMPKKVNQVFQQEFGFYVRQLYGSTETGTISVNLDVDVGASLESVGTPIDGIEVEVFADDGRIAAVDTPGEFAVRSPAAIRGYDNLDEVNQQVFRNGYFLTGDIGRKDENGLLYLIGRKKFFINKGGYKINPHDIEALLEAHPKVKEAVVIGVPTSYGDEKIKAVIVLKDACTEEELIEHCRGRIADFKLPSLIEFRDHLPKSATGKIRRQSLITPE